MSEWPERKKQIADLIRTYTPIDEAGIKFTIRRSADGWVTITFSKKLTNGITMDFIEGLLLGARLVGTYYSDYGPMNSYQAKLSFSWKE